jgi:transcriptional regulator with XRE-family HTH domain
MEISRTATEWEQLLGAHLRELRLLKNLDQQSLAERAGVSLNAIKHLEGGKGARVHSLIKTLRALERVDWLDALAPTVSISPMLLLRRGSREPRRARRRTRAPV